jgi:RNA polymerase sigma-70 factor (ECF subfamily)
MTHDFVSAIEAPGIAAAARETQLQNDVIELYDELALPLFRYIRSFGLSRVDGEEVLQEAFLALFQHLQRERSRSNLRGWIFRVAHNMALKRNHANRRTQNFAPFDEVNPALPPDPAPNPEQRASSIEHNDRLKRTLRSLPSQDQRCLFLRLEGLRYREIAKITGMSLGSISMTITRSLARLGNAGKE